MRLLVVDDHEIVREGLRSALSADPDTEIVGETGSGEEALRLMRRTLPDVLLTDFRLPDMCGDVLCRRVVADFPQTSVVVLTTYLSEEIVRQVIDAGARGFVTKASGLGELRKVLAGARSAHSPLADRCSSALVERLHRATAERKVAGVGLLTPQQERVLELTVQGFTYAQIGERLFISESTVRFHIQRLKERLGASNKAELIAVAIRSALIAPGGDGVPA
jgi:DNA-binding NarL/FixJ family response regulator